MSVHHHGHTDVLGTRLSGGTLKESFHHPAASEWPWRRPQAGSPRHLLVTLLSLPASTSSHPSLSGDFLDFISCSFQFLLPVQSLPITMLQEPFLFSGTQTLPCLCVGLWVSLNCSLCSVRSTRTLRWLGTPAVGSQSTARNLHAGHWPVLTALPPSLLLPGCPLVPAKDGQGVAHDDFFFF